MLLMEKQDQGAGANDRLPHLTGTRGAGQIDLQRALGRGKSVLVANDHVIHRGARADEVRTGVSDHITHVGRF